LVCGINIRIIGSSIKLFLSIILLSLQIEIKVAVICGLWSLFSPMTDQVSIVVIEELIDELSGI
jgi:hypothetical protein